MRTLLYIPIVHEEADLGAAGETLARQSASMAGNQRWALHRQTIRRFWKRVAAHLGSHDPRHLKLYQDGLPADGPLGMRIVEAAARRGSANYQLLLDLVHKGAELRKTEDLVLLLQERQNILDALAQPLAPGATRDIQASSRERDILTEKRDRSIAEAINTSLKEGELGALFIGAHHHVAAHLAADIQVIALKEQAMLLAYLEDLLLGRDDQRLKELARQVASPPHIPP